MRLSVSNACKTCKTVKRVFTTLADGVPHVQSGVVNRNALEDSALAMRGGARRRRGRFTVRILMDAESPSIAPR